MTVQAARAAAGCNILDAAFSCLKQAHALGWIPSEEEQLAPEFASLKSDPRW
ncbi:hypothetical protein IH601_05105 [Candidatus Bipolaricaulota bacterium]|nr:hypothetical protein [Candidatus Bipolaricaulota bacterium]